MRNARGKNSARDAEEVSDVSLRKKEINTREYHTRSVYPRSVKFVSRENDSGEIESSESRDFPEVQ